MRKFVLDIAGFGPLRPFVRTLITLIERGELVINKIDFYNSGESVDFDPFQTCKTFFTIKKSACGHYEQSLIATVFGGYFWPKIVDADNVTTYLSWREYYAIKRYMDNNPPECSKLAEKLETMLRESEDSIIRKKV